MKLLIVALPDSISDNDIQKATASILPDGVDVTGIILTEKDLKHLNPTATVAKKQKPLKTPFVKACESVMNRANHTIDEPAFRVEFYKDVLDGVIAKEIIEVLSWGPKCPTDLYYVKEKGMSNLITFAKIALGILDNM